MGRKSSFTEEQLLRASQEAKFATSAAELSAPP